VERKTGAERAKTRVEHSGEQVSEKKGGAEWSMERWAAKRERSGERRSQTSGLMQSGKTFHSDHVLCCRHTIATTGLHPVAHSDSLTILLRVGS